MSENTIYKSYAISKGVSQYGLDNKRLDYEALSNLIDGCVLCNEIVNVDDCLELVNGYDKLFNTSFGKVISNEELMLNNNYVSVYDCGQSIYVWNK